MALPTLIAAVDLGPQTGRVLYHAAAFARLLDLKLRMVHVSTDGTAAMHERVLNACLRQMPYQMDVGPDDVVVRRAGCRRPSRVKRSASGQGWS